jgi:hypothetical protein
MTFVFSLYFGFFFKSAGNCLRAGFQGYKGSWIMGFSFACWDGVAWAYGMGNAAARLCSG